jgi:hypothetical protein
MHARQGLTDLYLLTRNICAAGSFKSVPSQGINDGRKPYVPAKHDAGNHASSG